MIAKQTNKKSNKSIKNEQRSWTDIFPRTHPNGQHVYEKMFNITHIKEIQINTTVRSHLIPLRMGIFNKNIKNSKYYQGCREKGTLMRFWGGCNKSIVRENIMGVPQKFKNFITLWPSNHTSGCRCKIIEISILKRSLHPHIPAALFTIFKTGNNPNVPQLLNG